MKRFCSALFATLAVYCFPVIAGAAGTYYNGNAYQNTQSRYGTGLYNNQYNGRAYTQTNQQNRYGRNNNLQNVQNNYIAPNQNGVRVAKNAQAKNSVKQGFFGDAWLSHEFGQWKFDMNNAGSQLHYDNLSWNVLTLGGKYYFDWDTPLVIGANLRYGMQYDKATMVDDDISNGAYGYEKGISGYAMSVGTSKDGKQFGFNAAFGLTDFFKLGRVKITPSIGYRYFEHELLTKKNSGLTMDVYDDDTACISNGGETQCGPFVTIGPFKDSSNNIIYSSNTDEYGYVIPVYTDVTTGEYYVSDFLGMIPSNANVVFVSFGDTYYYRQSGTSHKYETVWQGPYVAMDMEYAINNNNLINAGIEFGLPMYESKGDQPYRIDWAHPTSVKDKGGLGDAYHLALNASWSTAITDSMMFSLGMTYDYYIAKDIDAHTYLNPSYYKNLLDTGFLRQEDYNYFNSIGWEQKTQKEIESVYKSMGIRAGLTINF